MSHLIDSYKLISNKLKKKKFPLRKPNYAEAIDQYAQIMNSFKREGNLMYAAFCCLSIGRCEQAIKNSSSAEASCFIDSGYLIWENEIKAFDNDYISFEENVTEAINCYLLAIKRFSIMGTLFFELATILKKLRKYEESAEYFNKAAEIMRTESPITAINSLKEAIQCKILECDYKGACDLLDTIVTIALESMPQENRLNQTIMVNHEQYENHRVPSSISLSLYPYALIEARVSLILLYILQDSFLKSQSHLGKLVNDINDNEGQSSDLTDETIALLNNLLMACERKEINGLQAIQRELWSSLTDMQNDILQRIWCANKMLL
ncbi:hypothetical protein PPL_03744 [Heterostelium album PN500]|uniref:Factor VIII intron 22 protein n=1 Tax=Heterostelium pallidum (strain ATCC 26659 / Pp 5 / PN500) TaxID=670386 RepID=D3B6J6_HETP5|nr:hypothetical protein PPL_03744 [Heterostelium album PN500]EFA82966.1 hypothetical protein PPL_03744 [Heterostelium album PN500]|eukprot:XP_020435083.1 hypothetical protein PPL_03744 [Heterostelium album PN500]